MTPPLIMVIAMGTMYAAGVYLMLDRSLTRVVLGFLLVGNATNILLLLTAGDAGNPPLTDGTSAGTEGMLDPLPQALILTAIVIAFSVTAFLLAMIYRSWRYVRDESLQDDLEDLRVALDRDKSRGGEAGTSGEYDDTEFGDEAVNPVDEHPADLDADSTPEGRAALREAAANLPDDAVESVDQHIRNEESEPPEDEAAGRSEGERENPGPGSGRAESAPEGDDSSEGGRA